MSAPEIAVIPWIQTDFQKKWRAKVGLEPANFRFPAELQLGLDGEIEPGSH
jgi:hypothetical protein